LQIDVSTLRICRNMMTSMMYDKLVNYLLQLRKLERRKVSCENTNNKFEVRQSQ